ncbi:30S ribosomal protein S4 [Planomonospora sp. ID91781]|uniref:Small ribosomal subunit protein uS4 n=3 Tax=Planomonospora TaxID=1998 RepID=A0A161LH42_9ACTN|nr:MULTISPECIES: 30S ribosomal protein S4 [Planomonospora]MBG0822429.1 30S ribosomal protein S4 [Planomonospora sp. ID91781]GAT64437.1 30S ribosomal protein S4 [Planomonospora sphaerica]GGK83119.1 30S ribosomal protein S4 [Planomonospora parontospora]GGL50792.1 30S ribosomal protein S4 [Planomonospora parontospora subsp. antibiotica]GII10421.1 30S ribosomal protein S4 [Planomonospora parontospora subsp. parontospora]
MRYTGPKVRLSRRAGVPLTRKAVRYFEERPYPPGEHGRKTNRRQTGDYGLRLMEKQKLRWYYDVSERQMRRYWDMALRSPGRSGAELVVLLESRLASLVLRAGLAPSIYAARQYVTHGHITVDGRKVDIPSYLVKPGQVIAVRERSRAMQPFVAAAEGVYADERTAPYLAVDHADLRFTVVSRPVREQIAVPVDEQMVVEFYSR